ncbi:MAG: YicC/YloC family endoribonuclease, partial [Methylophagaceae bacterium]
AELSTLAAPIDPVKVLQWPGVLKTESLDQVALHSSIMTLVRAAIDELIVTRETEGAALKTMIAQRCLQIDGIARDVRRRMPEILTQHQQRL